MILSRFSFLAIFVILQVLAISILFYYLGNDYLAAQIIFNIIAWGFVITLSFRSMPPEGKFTWAILILGFPPFGSILYLMFSKNLTSNRQKKIHDALNVRSNMYNLKDDSYDEEMKEIMPLRYYRQMEYIYYANKQFGFKNTRTDFFPSGEEFFEDIQRELKQAKEFIFIEFFIIGPGKFFDTIVSILEEKIKEGVEVRLIFDDIGSIQKVPFGYWNKLKEKGIKVVRFNRFIPVVSAIHNNRDHRKILIIDGKIGYTGGINLSDEYINVTHPFGYWKDSGIKLIGQAVDELTLMFLSSYDLQTRQIDTNISRYLERYDVYNHEGVVVPYGDGPRPAYLEYVGENVYINMINAAEKYIWITSPYLIVDSKIVNALQNAASKGVDVRIVTPHIPDKKFIFMITRSYYKRLQKYGVKIYEYTPGFIHAKQVLCDDDVGIVGTINLDYRSLLHHYENAVWMYKTSALKEMKDDFNEIFESSEKMDGFKQNWFITFICKAGELFQPFL